MIKTILAKAMGATAAAAVIAVPSFGVVAPQIEHMSSHVYSRHGGKCDYYDTVTTHTKVTLAKSIIRKGEKDSAKVTVTSNDSQPVAGTVTFIVNGKTIDQKTLSN